MSEDALVCCKCGAIIGAYTIGRDGRVWLQIGNAMLHTANGYCVQCDGEYNWCASDRLLHNLVDRIAKQY